MSHRIRGIRGVRPKSLPLITCSVERQTGSGAHGYTDAGTVHISWRGRVERQTLVGSPRHEYDTHALTQAQLSRHHRYSKTSRLRRRSPHDRPTGPHTSSRLRTRLQRTPRRRPLRRRTMDVLNRAHDYADASGFVFPSATGRMLSDSTLSKLLRENAVPCVPHGFRSTFRVWAAECSSAPREVAEMALAHVEGSAAELAYRRTDYFQARRSLMHEWAKVCMPQ